ncbi:hypothetical protein AVEN_170359-1 [Araneus ventricosus]|uniref:Uncharacterized protein n=1 Tax=Araneus ventricosus TaxID=182803 RepID=A0A4Y2CA52_ARAVE|nr:hypothetical protein AVEN_170359-1 [Araneus ventricosus]
MLVKKEAQKVKKTFKTTKTRDSDCKTGVVTKELKYVSCKKTEKPEFLTLMRSAGTSKEIIMQRPAYDEIYFDRPSVDWIECCKCHT